MTYVKFKTCRCVYKVQAVQSQSTYFSRHRWVSRYVGTDVITVLYSENRISPLPE